ncbi:glycosyltransferase [Paenibacillus sp. TRM 82003]|uniref:glycosyltransferase n=1 Tax=Kineococcus sp. TRM81007 TaxID=2925831 RepID=UPI001F5A3A10|nr:glycosyltransferase [Kineococcus sp. TRM81007]MCI2240675.1 glycosyltransferase [Kineococcus sp. TRM81007]MCI3925403.1 glycosyltransferase [Paenibacillus sp. TRM 82003]
MRVLVWHVHGSWMTAFVSGAHEYLLPLVDDRGPDGRGRARTWDWPASAVEVPVADLREAEFDVVVLQRPEELELVERWTGRRPGRDVPAVYVEHDAPRAGAADSRHPLADQRAVPIAHVTGFNRLYWDCGDARTTVVDHGVIDPGHRYTGAAASVAASVNEPVRRWRVAGTDVLLRVAEEVPVALHGMGVRALAERVAGTPAGAGLSVHEDLPQARLHEALGAHRAYLHPYRWTSLGLSMIEAMMIGMPVLALPATAAPEAVPPSAGVLSSDPEVLIATARRWLADPAEARERGEAARRHALAAFGVERFLADWDRLLEEVVA